MGGRSLKKGLKLSYVKSIQTPTRSKSTTIFYWVPCQRQHDFYGFFSGGKTRIIYYIDHKQE